MHRALTTSIASIAMWVALAPVGPHRTRSTSRSRSRLRRVAVRRSAADGPAGNSGDVGGPFQATLDEDLAAAAPIAVVDRRSTRWWRTTPGPRSSTSAGGRSRQFLLSGTVVRAGGELVVEARLIDLVSGEYAFAKRYRAGVSAAPWSHTLWPTTWCRSSPAAPALPVPDRVHLGPLGRERAVGHDWNGSNPAATKHGSIALAPAWAPDGSKLVFTSFLRGNPALFELIRRRYLRPLWNRGGCQLVCQLLPDGSRSPFASSVDGNVDIYAISTRTARLDG